MTFLAVLPSIVPPYTERCLAGMCPELLARVGVVDNSKGVNLGVAASWNVAARCVLEEQLDWLVIISAATRFGAPGGADFLEGLEARPDAWVIASEGGPPEGPVVGWHLLAWSRVHVLERVGLFDENFWPAYGEDMDISRRIHIAIEEDGVGGSDPWTTWDVDAQVEMVNHGARLGGILGLRNGLYHKLNEEYLARKWGDLRSDDAYRRPFNNPGNGLDFWPEPPDPRATRHRGTQDEEVVFFV